MAAEGRTVDRAQVWREYATSYDEILPRLSFYREAVRRHVTALKKSTVRGALDVGAGTGNVAVRVASRERRVMAVDLSTDMLAHLGTKRGARNVNRINADGANLRFLPDKSFEAVTFLLALFDMVDPIGALLESWRVLRSGGRMVITEPKTTFELTPLIERAELELRRLVNWETLRVHWRRVQRVNDVIDPSIRRALPAECIVGRLRKMGCRSIETVDSHLGQCSFIVAVKP